jgi:hypothetical protein
MITSINNFPSIRSLQTLSISNNSINDLSSFINAVKTKYPHIKSLNTLKNTMNPGMGQPSAYNQYRAYMKNLGNQLTELDGMNINDNSFMNQQQQPKRDLFGTSTTAQPKRDLFGTTSSTTKVNFFDTPSTNTSMNTNMNTNMNNMNMNTNTIAASVNPAQQANKPRMGMFDNMPKSTTPISQSTNMFATMGVANTSTPTVPMNNAASQENTSGLVFKRQFFVIDESAEIDGTEFVISNKKPSTIMVNEKILKKSDNMTKFNRKNRSEGNKHILNSEL